MQVSFGVVHYNPEVAPCYGSIKQVDTIKVAPSLQAICSHMEACDMSGIGLKVKMVWLSIPSPGHV